MISIKSRQLLLIALLTFIVCATFGIMRAIKCSKHPFSETPEMRLQKLPDDVEMVLKKCTIRETNSGLSIQISGNQVINRGREILGLRSNLIKATYIKNIRGTLITPKGTVTFSAKDGEWDTKSSSPLILRNIDSLSINDKKITDVNKARLYLQKGIMELSGKNRDVIQLK